MWDDVVKFFNLLIILFLVWGGKIVAFDVFVFL